MLYCAMIRRADQDQEGKLIPTERNTSENCKEIKKVLFHLHFSVHPNIGASVKQSELLINYYYNNEVYF